MRDVTVLDFTRAAYTQMLMAEKGIWNEQQASWDFFDGQILTLNPNGSSTKVGFDRYVYPLGSGPVRLAEVEKDAVNMTVAEAVQAERLYTEAGSIKEARKIRVRIQEKFTVPLTCLVFGLFGATLGSLPSCRTSRSFSFVLALGISVYYVIGFSFSSLGVKGTLYWPPGSPAVVVGGWRAVTAPGQSLIHSGRIKLSFPHSVYDLPFDLVTGLGFGALFSCCWPCRSPSGRSPLHNAPVLCSCW